MAHKHEEPEVTAASYCASCGSPLGVNQDCRHCHHHGWERHKTVHQTVSWGFPSFLAYVGAAIYFIGLTNGTFWAVVLALLKAIIWPAYFVYHVLLALGVS